MYTCVRWALLTVHVFRSMTQGYKNAPIKLKAVQCCSPRTYVRFLFYVVDTLISTSSKVSTIRSIDVARIPSP